MMIYADDSIDVSTHADEAHITVMYPNNPDSIIKHVVVNQCSVRASDGLRLHYDYERDGFVIEQASKWEWDADDDVCDPDWQEVAFVQSWARESDEAPEGPMG